MKKIKFDIDDVVYDLKSSIALWIEDNGVYAFSHRSLQEYFAAQFICDLPKEEKIRVYEKIDGRTSDHDFRSEIENLLSLLEEMDPYSFRKYYSIPLYEGFILLLQKELGKPVATGQFGADMRVALENDGPVTIWIDSKARE